MELKDIESMTISELISSDVIRLMIGAGSKFPENMEGNPSSVIWPISETCLIEYLSNHNKNTLDIVMDIDKLSSLDTGGLANKKHTGEINKTEKNGSVYLMLNERNGYIKIGFTSNRPEYRESTLQSEEPEIKLINVFRNKTMRDESKLHQLYDHLRIRGEWFSLKSGHISDIEKLMGCK